MTTVKTYLRSQAVRTTEDFRVGEDGVYGIDWDSSWTAAHPPMCRESMFPCLSWG